jgi:hypothetical protein
MPTEKALDDTLNAFSAAPHHQALLSGDEAIVLFESSTKRATS